VGLDAVAVTANTRGNLTETRSACGVAGNTYNITTFTSVSTTRLRLSITSRTGYSTGVLEWMALRTGS
jgi:hypothetical protein